MRIYLLLWPYMIYNPMYMPVPPLAVKNMTHKTYIPKNTYKKSQEYKNKIIQHNIRAQIKSK